MSLKERGNQFFRVGRYEEAIKCYQEYIEYDASADKKAAYCNISFCYFKMQKYRQSIEAADDCISEDSSYGKAYYRKKQAYKQIPHSEYDIFINIVLLLRYSPTMQQKQRYDLQTQLKEAKKQWLATINKKSLLIQPQSLDTLEIKEEKDNANEIINRPVQEWVNQWKHSKESLKHQWNTIQDIATTNSTYAINCAFLFLNQLPSTHQAYPELYKKVIEFQSKVEGQMQIQGQQQPSKKEEKMQVQHEGLPKQSKKSESSQENLFESSEEKRT